MVLYYSSAAISIDMNGRVCSALVQLGCYQHKYTMNEFKPHLY